MPDEARLLAKDEQDVFDVLANIERGEESLVRTKWDMLVEYEASNGWAFRVFDDSGEWDYIDSYRRPGGEWEESSAAEEGVLWWRPRNMQHWNWHA